jgi:nucleotide-binding universal stress UspA family protein
MTSQQMIVVGVDGTDRSRAAARHAIAAAARRGAWVLAVRAFELPGDSWADGYDAVLAPDPGQVTEIIESRTRGMLAAVAEELGGAALAVPVDAVALLGPPAKVLVEQARNADLLVVGHRGRGAVASRVLGSVGLHCLLHATCSVTVIPLAVAAQPVTDPAAGAVPAPA